MSTSSRSKFIERSKAVHGDRYGYDHVDYLLARVKVKIICLEHGEFEQLPSVHLQGSGCRKCFSVRQSNIRRLNTKEFIRRAKDVWGNLYDYSLVEYVNMKSKVKIICQHHGEFEQQAKSHLSGFGCRLGSNPQGGK